MATAVYFDSPPRSRRNRTMARFPSRVRLLARVRSLQHPTHGVLVAAHVTPTRHTHVPIDRYCTRNLLSGAAPACLLPVPGLVLESVDSRTLRHSTSFRLSRRDRLEPTADPCPHAVRTAHSMVARLDRPARSPATTRSPDTTTSERVSERGSPPFPRPHGRQLPARLSYPPALTSSCIGRAVFKNMEKHVSRGCQEIGGNRSQIHAEKKKHNVFFTDTDVRSTRNCERQFRDPRRLE